MNEDKIVAVVRETTDYTKFKHMVGNRELGIRPAKIKQSIEEIGYILNPILVNENKEIGDGQGRFEALKELGLPVHYIEEPGLGLRECIALNAKNTTWSLEDYVNSYIVQGNENYIRLKELFERHKLPVQPTLSIAKGYYGGFSSKNGVGNDAIKRGIIELSEEEVSRADEILSFTDSFYFLAKKIGGSYNNWRYALTFCYLHKKVDNERLKKQIFVKQAEIQPCATVVSFLRNIEKVYNFKCRNKVHLEADYEDMCTSRSANYRARWANKRKGENTTK